VSVLTLHRLESGAIFSECGRYRYALWREWGDPENRVCFLMVNPSTADYHDDDQTLTKCTAIAKRWGFEALDVVNLFGWVSPYVVDLLACVDPVGPGNDTQVVDCVRRASRVVLAWGRYDKVPVLMKARADRVRDLLEQHARGEVGYLGLNGDGSPKHPLFLAKSTAFVRGTA
jgi:hypothetical protein